MPPTIARLEDGRAYLVCVSIRKELSFVVVVVVDVVDPSAVTSNGASTRTLIRS